MSRKQIADVKARRASSDRRREACCRRWPWSATPTPQTTLFNRLAARSLTSDALFVTLDRCFGRCAGRGPQILLSDTVGFIDRLPHSLVAAFRATLEEVVQADLLLHVVDAADPDRERHIDAVERVLTEIEAHEVPRLRVYNKVDRLSDEERARIDAGPDGAVTVSAAAGLGIETLEREVSRRLALDTERVRLEFNEGDEDHQAASPASTRHARVLTHQATDAGSPSRRTYRGGG